MCSEYSCYKKFVFTVIHHKYVYQISTLMNSVNNGFYAEVHVLQLISKLGEPN